MRWQIVDWGLVIVLSTSDGREIRITKSIPSSKSRFSTAAWPPVHEGSWLSRNSPKDFREVSNTVYPQAKVNSVRQYEFLNEVITIKLEIDAGLVRNLPAFRALWADCRRILWQQGYHAKSLVGSSLLVSTGAESTQQRRSYADLEKHFWGLGENLHSTVPVLVHSLLKFENTWSYFP